jgi:hypothetical protein
MGDVTAVSLAESDRQDAFGQAGDQFIYRSMAACSSLPCVGDRDLGVRVDWDVKRAADGTVNPLEGGMSVAPDDPLRLPVHRRPPSLGGTGKKPVWETTLGSLPGELSYRQTSEDHGLVEPVAAVQLDEFRAHLGSTADSWSVTADV